MVEKGSGVRWRWLLYLEYLVEGEQANNILVCLCLPKIPCGCNGVQRIKKVTNPLTMGMFFGCYRAAAIIAGDVFQAVRKEHKPLFHEPVR